MDLQIISPMMGNDPELFIKMGNRVLPAESILYRKHKKIKIDNAAIELQPGPSSCLQEQNKCIADALGLVQSALTKQGLDKAHVSLRPVEQLRAKDIEDFRSVCMFGCQPSLVFDGQDLRRSQPMVNPRKVRYRSVGYHVHMGVETPELLRAVSLKYENTPYYKAAQILHSTEGRVRLVQMCDLFVGLPAVLLERDARVPIRRKVLGYGKAGEFREQPHGFEYRTLGSWPLLHPMWGWWANAAVRDVLQFVVHDQDQDLQKGIDMVKVAEVINDNNLAEALEFWHKAKRNLAPIQTAWGPIEKNYYLTDSHPLLDKSHIAKLEFLAMKQNLKNKVFNFGVWCNKEKHPADPNLQVATAYLNGFPNASKKTVEEFEDWVPFSEAWTMDKDLLSKQMLA